MMQHPPDLDLSLIPSPTLLVRGDGSIVRANNHSERLFGYGEGELAGFAFEQLILAVHRQEWQQSLETAFADQPGPPPEQFLELSAVTSDGREIAVEIGIGPSANAPCAVIVVQDITGQARIPPGLRASERHLRVGLTHTTNLVQYLDVDRDSLDWYGDLDGLLGYKPGEFPTTLSGWLELIHPDDVDRIQASLEEVIENDEDGWHFRYRLRAKDGSYRHILDRGSVTGHLDGRPNEGVGGIVDETEHVLHREEVKQGQRQFRRFMETTPDALILVRKGGTILFANEQVESVLGYSPDELVGAPLETIIPDRFRGPHASHQRGFFEAPTQRPMGEGMSLFALRRDGTEIPVEISLSSVETDEGVVVSAAIRDVSKRIEREQELRAALEEVGKLKERLQGESTYLQEELAATQGFDEIIGDSDALAEVLALVESVAPTQATVLLLGETGTGKELLARAIHNRSQRQHRPLIKVDCAALPASLIESELFGHEKGAFTGAHERRPGRFELAHDGTIFLDEVGELPWELQSKLLRVIEEGEFRRVGGKSDQTVDVRVIAATNRPLRLEVQEGRFRPDLYFRLSVFPIEAPPLRERREDIPALVSFFAARYSDSFGKSVRSVDPRSVEALIAYDWPGNVRELRNVIERSMIVCTGDTLTVNPALLGQAGPSPVTSGRLKEDLQSIERARIVRALEGTGWKIKGDGNAASRLGVTPSSLRSRMKKLGITRPTLGQGDGEGEVTSAL